MIKYYPKSPGIHLIAAQIQGEMEGTDLQQMTLGQMKSQIQILIHSKP